MCASEDFVNNEGGASVTVTDYDIQDPHQDSHQDLHSEQGALAGEHPGRASDPVIKVRDIAWLEFQKPDLARAEEHQGHDGPRPRHRRPQRDEAVHRE